MKHFTFFLITLLSSFSFSLTTTLADRRILHQPLLIPATSAPPPEFFPPPPPPDITPPSPVIPFFNELPTGPPPPLVANNQNLPSPSIANPTATKPTKPAKKVAIAVSVAFSLFVIFSVVAFFLYKHRIKHSSETETRKLGGENSNRILEASTRVPPPSSSSSSSFLYIGTVVEPNRTPVSEPNRFNKLNPIGNRHRPSPELHPLPPLTKSLVVDSHSPPAVSSSSSSSEEDNRETRETAFHSPRESSSLNLSHEESYYMPVSRRSHGSPTAPVTVAPVVPHSKRTSPKSRLSGSSPEMKRVMIPSIKQHAPPSPSTQFQHGSPRRPKFSSPPPAPNLMHLHSNDSRDSLTLPPPRPPPPPPPPPVVSVSSSSVPRTYQWTRSMNHGVDSASGNSVNVKKALKEDDEIEMDEAKPKLKALHWDKVRATSDRATVWDQLKSSSFQ